MYIESELLVPLIVARQEEKVNTGCCGGRKAPSAKEQNMVEMSCFKDEGDRFERYRAEDCNFIN